MDPAVKAELKKLSSAQLCSSALGQACMDVVVNPPKPGEPSYEAFMKVKQFFVLFVKEFKQNLTFFKEKNNVLNGLKEKARLVTELFNKIEGVKCNPVQGAMYAFPQISLPQKAIAHAKVIYFIIINFFLFDILNIFSLNNRVQAQNQICSTVQN